MPTSAAQAPRAKASLLPSLLNPPASSFLFEWQDQGFVVYHFNNNRKQFFKTTPQTTLYKGTMRMFNRCLLSSNPPQLSGQERTPMSSTRGPAREELASLWTLLWKCLV